MSENKKSFSKQKSKISEFGRSPLEKSSEESSSIYIKKKKSNNLYGLFQVYLKLLQGRDLNLDEEVLLSKQYGSFINANFDDRLPHAIIMQFNMNFFFFKRFPNPDHKSYKSMPSQKPQNIMEFISNVVKGQNDLEKLLFLKAVELVLSKLDQDKKKYTDEVQSLQSSSRIEERQSFINSLNSPNMLTTHQQSSLIKKSLPNKFKNDSVLQKDEVYDQLFQNLRNMKKSKLIEYLALDFSNLKKIQPRKMSQGGYYEINGEQWVRTGQDTADVLTLMRHVILFQLGKNGFNTSMYFSENGKHILCKIMLSEENLKTVAQQFGAQKEINIYFCDLFSFEPVDHNLRPLRLNNRLWKPHEYQGTEMLNYLRPKIIELLEKINFKRLAREVNQSGINQSNFNYGKVDFNDDEKDLTDEEWVAFYQYLVHMEALITQYRNDSKMDNDISSLIEQQVDPFNLYMRRNKYREELLKVNKSNVQNLDNYTYYLEFQAFKERAELMVQNYKDQLILKKIPKTRYIKILKKEQLSVQYMKTFIESIKIANSQKHILFSVWDRLNTKPLEPFIKYSNPDRSVSLGMRTKQINCWKKYQVSEENQLSLFSSPEQIKLTYQALNNIMLLNDLMQKKMISKIFCVHDHYELFGHCQDYDKVMSDDSNFYRKKTFFLAADWRLNIQAPWQIPIDIITEYYGAKIGLYFYYLSYFTYMTAYIGLIGLICSLIQWLIWDNNDERYVMITVIFSGVQVQWTSLLDDVWEQKQQLFNLKQGISSKEKQITTRSKFLGDYYRSVENDQMNTEQQRLIDFIRRLFYSALVLFLITMLYGGLMIGLFMITLALSNVYSLQQMTSVSLEVTITATLNIILIHIFDIFYERICVNLTDYENHQTVQEYESSYIIKKFLLEFVSYLGPLIFISYVNGPSNVYCFQNNCQLHVQYHFSTLIIWLFTFKMFKYMKFIYELIKIPIFKYQLDQEDLQAFILEQSKRESFAISQERYGTISDYMEIFIYNSLLSMFGYSFPFSFFLVFLQSIAQLFADRTKFLYLLQRPWPQNDSSLGVWRVILQLISYVCLLNNSGSAVIIYARKYNYSVSVLLVIILSINCSFKFVLGSVFGTTPYIVDQLIRRQKYILKSTYEQFKKNTASSSSIKTHNLKKFPIFKIFGSVSIKQDIGLYEDVSSQSDLEDYYSVLNDSNYDLKEIKAIKPINSKKAKTIYSQATSPLKSFKNISQQDSIIYQKPKSEIVKRTQKSNVNNKTLIKSDQSPLDSKISEKQKNIQQTLNKTFEENEKITNIDELTFSFLQNHYFKRLHDWAFKFQVYLANPKMRNKIKEKYFKLMYHLELISKYKILWTEKRFTTRYFFLKRKHRLMRNLDWRKVLIFKQNLSKMTEVYTEKAENKYRKRIQYLEKSLRDDDRNELKLTLMKYDKHKNKHTWVQSRKVVVLKVKGIWFSRYRKSVYKQPSIKTVKEFYKRTLMIEQFKPESKIYQQYDQLVDYKNIHLVDLEKFLELFTSIDYEQRDHLDILLTSRPYSILDFYSSNLRTQEHKTICEKYKDSFIFDCQTNKLQEICMQYFQEQIFPVKSYKLIKYHHNQIWVALDENKKQILLKFMKIKHNQQLHQFTKSKTNHGIFFAEAYQSQTLCSVIDMIDDYNYKGFATQIYQIKGTFTLASVLQYRSFYSIPYKQKDLQQFLYSNCLLLQERKHGDISSQNYFLHYQEYALIYPNNKNPDIPALAVVLLEMIKLQRVSNFEDEISNVQHALKDTLIQMYRGKYTADDILYDMKPQSPFLEIVLDQEQTIEQLIKKNNAKKEFNLHDYLQDMLHKLNYYLRMRKYKEIDYLFQQFVKQIKITLFDDESDQKIQIQFLEFIKINFQFYILNKERLKIINYVIQIFYMKFSSDLLQRKNITNDTTNLIQTIEVFKDEIEILIRELCLNLKTDNLNKDDKNTILKRRKIELKLQINMMESTRAQILKTLRKHQSYIKIINEQKRKLYKLINQLNALLVIQNYLNRQLQLGIQRLQDIIQTQIIIVRNDPLPNIEPDPGQISPRQFNFNQQSPIEKDEEFNELFDLQSLSIYQYYETYPNMVLQLIYYEYLQLILLFDSNDEDFEIFYKSFKEIKIDNILYHYYLQQLTALYNFKHKIQELPDESDLFKLNKYCLIGRYINLGLFKWQEQYIQPQDVFFSEDVQYFWRHIQCISFVQQSFQNYKILKQSLEYYKENDLISLMIQQKLIHLLINMDDYYFPITSFDPIKDFDLSYITNYELKTKINDLKRIHSQLIFKQKSWINHIGLIKFKAYHLLSIFFTYGPKHIENIMDDNMSILSEAIKDYNSIIHNEELLEMTMKRAQIMQYNQQYFNTDGYHNLDTRYQNINSYLYLKYINEGSLNNLYQAISQYTKAENFRNTLFIISFIQFHISIQQYELADLIIEYSRKLFDNQSIIMQHSHFGFMDDLVYLDLKLNRKQISQISPLDELFIRQEEYKFAKDVSLYFQIILYNNFLNLQYESAADQLIPQLLKIKEIPHLKNLHDVGYCLVMYFHSCIGNNQDDKLQIIQSYKYQEGSFTKFMIDHIMSRFYTSVKDYEQAFYFSKRVLDFIFSLEAQTSIFVRETKQTYTFYYINPSSNLVQIYKPTKIDILYNDGDFLIKHLYDDMLIRESLLIHLDILTNLPYVELPRISVVFRQLQLYKNNFQQAYLLKIIAQMFIAYADQEKYMLLKNQLLSDYSRKIKKLNRQKLKLKKLYQNKVILKKATQQDTINYINANNILDYELSVYQTINEQLNISLINNWSIQAAEKAINAYEYICKQLKLKTHFHVAELSILLSKNFQQLQMLQMTLENMNQAQNKLDYVFDEKQHPILGYFYLQCGLMKRWLRGLYYTCVEQLQDLNQFNKSEQKLIISRLLQGDMQINKYFDNYLQIKNAKQFIKELKVYLDLNILDEIVFTETIQQPHQDMQIFYEVLDYLPQIDYNGNQYLGKAYEIFFSYNQNHQFMQLTQTLLDQK